MKIRSIVFGLLFSILRVNAQDVPKIKMLSLPPRETPETLSAKQKEEINSPVIDFKPSGSNKQASSAGASSMSAINSHIVGGSAASRGSFPWQVAILQDNAWFCGGSLIDPLWVVTAGHCAYHFKVTIGANNADRPETGSIVLMTKIKFVHPDYNRDTIANDIALVKLPRAVTIGQFINIIRLPKQSEASKTFEGSKVTISGWGLIKDGGATVSSLNSVSVPVISNTLCAETFGSTYVRSSNVCVSGSGRKGSCQGDSGGPLSLKEGDSKSTLIGLVSYGANTCVRSYPSVFTRVTSYLGWISKTTNLTMRA